MKHFSFKYLILLISACGLAMAASCSDGKSYAQLLNDENKAINQYLADQHVILDIPEDTVFICGENAPFYKMDADGNVYMQVIDPGTPGNRATADQLIYFRFTRYNLYSYSNGELPQGSGNESDLSMGEAAFRYENYTLQSSYQWGSGIQLPLAYLPIDCRVRMIIKSQYGVYSEISNVVPYLYEVRYYPART